MGMYVSKKRRLELEVKNLRKMVDHHEENIELLLGVIKYPTKNKELAFSRGGGVYERHKTIRINKVLGLIIEKLGVEIEEVPSTDKSFKLVNKKPDKKKK